MPYRTGKQIRDRFLNNLDIRFKKRKFSEEEDKVILKYHIIYGNKWSEIAKKMEARTGDMVKNRFYSFLKKKLPNNKKLLKKKGNVLIKYIEIIKILIKIIQKSKRKNILKLIKIMI